MSWRFWITKSAERDIAKLDTPIRRRVKEKLAWFMPHFEAVSPQPLGFAFKGFFKLRVGDWRIVYEVREGERLVVVHAVDRRDTIYRRKP